MRAWFGTILVAGVLAAAAAPAALAQPDPPQEQDQSEYVTDEMRRSATAAVLNLVRAIETGDRDGMLDLIWAGRATAQRLGRDLFTDLVVNERALERAAALRFGDAGVLRARFDQVFTGADRAKLENAGFFWDPLTSTLRIFKAGESAPMRLRRTMEGGQPKWTVLIDAIDMGLDDEPGRLPPGVPGRPNPYSRIRLQQYQAIVDGVHSTTERILQGQLTSVAAASEELAAKVQAASAQYLKDRSELFRQRFGR